VGVAVGGDVVRNYYAELGAPGLRSRTQPDWDSVIVDEVAAYLGRRERVLDVGCGYGRIAHPLAVAGYQVIGLDISEPLLRHAGSAAAERGVRLPLTLADMTKMPFSDASFDGVICLWSAFFELVATFDQVDALTEMKRVLAQGGLALIEGPAPPLGDTDLPADRISHGVVEGIPMQGYIHDLDTLKRRCAQAGIADYELCVRDWAGRDRTILTLQR
jgi:ubiquinone/menaquinone biosynthesis C-methylase UbiE